MKWNFLFFVITTLFFIECKEKSHEKNLKSNVTNISNPTNMKVILKEKGDSMLVPDLKLEVSLSNDAVYKLKENKESVVASVFLYGDVEDEDILPEEIKNDIGPDGLKLGIFEMEEKNISSVIIFNFSKLSIPQKLYKSLSSQDVSVNINVFSGRKYFKDNILNMESFDAKLSKVVSQKNTVKLSGHLIPETISIKE
ncbi:hypothetical protein OZ668_15285 [Elizabethkingia sp. HX XZB]|uniref:hypothetical protein n=1 Tax=Elizabethkingia sp. HX XZB TaxID=3003193 RepID=UPI002A2444ED|nr:hypothetical protein [Elizabethkingia sp. HX XZB]MDX8569363.1 hypothetical protein [Elizabethkingia sp. HX XZB]